MFVNYVDKKKTLLNVTFDPLSCVLMRLLNDRPNEVQLDLMIRVALFTPFFDMCIVWDNNYVERWICNEMLEVV